MTVTVAGGLGATTGSPVTCVGLSTTLSNTTTGGAWTSSSNSIATVSPSGMVTGVAPGTSNISYAAGAGCVAVTMVTVNGSVPVITGTTNVCVGSNINLSNTAGGGVWSSSNPALGTVSASGVVTGVAPGTPTISYTLVAGCYKTMNITVKAVPVPITGNTALCTGATSTVTDATPTGVSWTSSAPAVASIGSGSGLITGISAGTSMITYLANSGCIATKVVTVDVAPSVPAITGLSSVIVAHTITLSDATVGGVWSSSNAAKATVDVVGTVTGVGSGAATISYAVTNGVCVKIVTKALTVTASRPAVAEAMAGEASLLRVYPNPTTGAFTLQSSQAGVFTVYTMEGKEVQHNDVNEGLNSLSLPKGLAAGVYMCRFNGEDGSSVMVRLVYE